MSANEVANSADLVAGGAMTLSQGATEQASSIEELTASLEQISSQTDLNAQNAETASQMATNAKREAEQGNDQMTKLLGAMDAINSSSSSINKIIKVIDDIAFQTNILALNAAVEAARAGQHGKGFAVVAEEVRNLAAKSANAVKETTMMIDVSTKNVESGIRIANGTADALKKIVTEVSNANELVGAIAIASREQAVGIEQLNQGIMQVSQVTQSNAANSEESAAASEELSSQANQLMELVSLFKLKHNLKKLTA
jgi:methyl-accepting chemotaxis protein